MGFMHRFPRRNQSGKGKRPQPRQTYGRSSGLHGPADDSAVGEHVELAGTSSLSRAKGPFRRTERYGISDQVFASVCLDVGGPDQLAPLVGVINDKLAEAGGRAHQGSQLVMHLHADCARCIDVAKRGRSAHVIRRTSVPPDPTARWIWVAQSERPTCRLPFQGL
jgi:hypothetical protein